MPQGKPTAGGNCDLHRACCDRKPPVGGTGTHKPTEAECEKLIDAYAVQRDDLDVKPEDGLFFLWFVAFAVFAAMIYAIVCWL